MRALSRFSLFRGRGPADEPPDVDTDPLRGDLLTHHETLIREMEMERRPDEPKAAEPG